MKFVLHGMLVYSFRILCLVYINLLKIIDSWIQIFNSYSDSGLGLRYVREINERTILKLGWIDWAKLNA